MGWQNTLKGWQDSIPNEEKVRTVINVIEGVFQEWKWNKRGSHIIVTDNRLSYYKKKINPDDKRVPPTGSFHVPTVKGKKVKGYNLLKIIQMSKIVEAYERIKK